MPITRTVLETAQEHPDQPAIVGVDGRLSYAELVAESRRVFAVVDAVHRAQSAPPQPAPETRGIPITAVSIASAFHAARIVASLAGYRAVSATIDPQWPLAHRMRVITAAGIGFVISDDAELDEALAAAGWTGTILSFAEFRAREEKALRPLAVLRQAQQPFDARESLTDPPTVRDVPLAPPTVRDIPLGPLTVRDIPLGPLTVRNVPVGPPTVRDGDEAFLLLFSSGTTSDPKAFLKTRRQYRANVAVSSAHLEPLPGVETLAPGPLSYSLTLYALIECLATGGGAHLADIFDPVRIAQRVADERITRVVAVPAVVQALTDAARRDPSRFAGLDLVVTGGANLPAALREGLATALPHVRLISYYGAAEIGFIGDSRGGDGTAPDDGTVLDIYDGIGAEIRDDAGSVLPESELGTLWIRAAACSDGYLAATTEAVLRGSDGWATVHDVARIVDGRLQLAGRAGDIVATGGHKVSLPEVERAFDGMPGISAVCAVALPDPRLGSVVALVIEGAGSGQVGAPGLHPLGRRTLGSEEDPAGNLLPSEGSPPEHAAQTSATGIAAAKRAGITKPAGSTEPTEITEPAGLANPSEPSEPTHPTDRPPISKAELQAWARARLAPQFVPRRWYRVARLPRTAGGKIRRPATAALVVAGKAVRL